MRFSATSLPSQASMGRDKRKATFGEEMGLEFAFHTSPGTTPSYLD